MMFLRCILLLSVLLLSGCASVFVPYPERAASMRQSIGNKKQMAKAIKTLKKRDESQNKQLTNLELGRLEQLDGNFAASQKAYGAVIQRVRQNQLDAKVQISHILQGAGAVVVNDRVIPYRLSQYEIVFLYGYQALNYLGQGDYSDAMVSIRRADEEQKWIAKQHAKAVDDAMKEAKKKDLKWELNKYKDYFKQTMDAASKVRKDNENAFLYYLSGIMYLANGDESNAAVSLKNALKVDPNNKALKTLLDYIQQPKHQQDEALVVVLFEQGLVPEKEAVNVPVPIIMGNSAQIQMFMFPAYKTPWQPSPHMTVYMNGESHKSSVIMHVYPLAAKALEDELPMIYLRQALSVIFKAAATASAYNNPKDQAGAAIAGNVIQLLSLMTAGADQRSWLTLPYTEQIVDQYVPASTDHLVLRVKGEKRKIPLHLTPGQVDLVWVVGTHGKLIIHQLPIKGTHV